MDYFNNVLTTFLGLLVALLSMQGQNQKALGFLKKYLNLCSEDERRFYSVFYYESVVELLKLRVCN